MEPPNSNVLEPSNSRDATAKWLALIEHARSEEIWKIKVDGMPSSFEPEFIYQLGKGTIELKVMFFFVRCLN